MHPLRIGLSTLAEVDVSADGARAATPATAPVRFDPGPQAERRAEAVIDAVIRDNLGLATARATPAVAANLAMAAVAGGMEAAHPPLSGRVLGLGTITFSRAGFMGSEYRWEVKGVIRT